MYSYDSAAHRTLSGLLVGIIMPIVTRCGKHFRSQSSIYYIHTAAWPGVPCMSRCVARVQHSYLAMHRAYLYPYTKYMLHTCRSYRPTLPLQTPACPGKFALVGQLCNARSVLDAAWVAIFSTTGLRPLLLALALLLWPRAVFKNKRRRHYSL